MGPTMRAVRSVQAASLRVHGARAFTGCGATLKKDIIITCAVTGSGDSTGISPLVPKTPEEIANACIEAGNAGAAIAHLHVRDPKTGAAARELAYYKEVADRIRDSDSNVIINMTCGMGGDFQPGEGRDYF